MKLAWSTVGMPEVSIADAAAMLVQMGYDGVEICGYEKLGITPDLSYVQRHSIRRAFEERKLEIIGLTSYHRFFAAGWSFDDALSALERDMRLAADLGARSMRLMDEFVPPGGNRNEIADRMVDGWRQLGELGQELGVNLAIETHNDYGRGKDLAPLIRRLNSPIVRVIWNVANTWSRAEPPARSVSSLADLLQYVHIKDVRDDDGKFPPCPVGEGVAPLGEALRLLREADYDGWLCVEHLRIWNPQLPQASEAGPKAAMLIRHLWNEAVDENSRKVDLRERI